MGATHLVLATAAPAWKDTMLAAVKEQVHGDLRAGKDTPQIVLLTALGATPTLTTLDGTPFAVE